MYLCIYKKITIHLSIMRTLIKNEEQFKILEDFLKTKQYDLSIDTYEHRCNEGEPFIHTKEEAISDFNNVNYSDFNNPNCSSNSASLTEYSLNVSDVEYKLKELIEKITIKRRFKNKEISMLCYGAYYYTLSI